MKLFLVYPDFLKRHADVRMNFVTRLLLQGDT